MPAFKDSNGREWLLAIDAPSIREIRDTLKFDLMNDEAFDQLGNDPVLCVDVLWILCRSQRKDVADVDFGRALVGDSYGAAVEALIAARIAFFHGPRKSLLTSLAQKRAALEKLGTEQALKKIDDANLVESLVAKMMTELDQKLNLTGATGAKSLPDSSESTPPV